MQCEFTQYTQFVLRRESVWPRLSSITLPALLLMLLQALLLRRQPLISNPTVTTSTWRVRLAVYLGQLVGVFVDVLPLQDANSAKQCQARLATAFPYSEVCVLLKLPTVLMRHVVEAPDHARGKHIRSFNGDGSGNKIREVIVQASLLRLKALMFSHKVSTSNQWCATKMLPPCQD